MFSALLIDLYSIILVFAQIFQNKEVKAHANANIWEKW